MTEIGYSESFQPYTDPEFWNGHWFDDGDAAPRPIPPASIRSNIFAGRVLEERLPHMERLYPLETFRAGSTFNAAAYTPGTIGLFKSHALYPVGKGTPGGRVARLGEPEPQVALNFGKGEGYPQALEEFGLRYWCSVNWAVVTETKHGPGLVAFSGAEVVRRSSAEVSVPVGMAMNPVMPIEQTRHLLYKSSEFLGKISVMHICAYGKPKQVRSRQWLGSLVPKAI